MPKFFTLTSLSLTFGFCCLFALDSLDPGFSPHILGPGRVTAHFSHPSGALYLSGMVTEADGQPVSGDILRFDSVGNYDADYSIQLDGSIACFHILPDGFWLVGGSFSEIDGHATANLARMNPDGTVDLSFTVETGVLPNKVTCIESTPTGSIYIGMRGLGFYGFDGSQWTMLPPTVLVRLHGDGTHDESYAPALALEEDPYAYSYDELRINDLLFDTVNEKLLVAGNFQKVNGADHSVLIRLETDGTTDPLFLPSFGDTSSGPYYAPFATSTEVHVILSYENDQYLIGGNFTEVNGSAQPAVAVLNTDGNLEPSFRVFFNALNDYYDLSVEDAVVDSNGNIVLAGRWSDIEGNSKASGSARVDAYGRLDSSFEPRFGSSNTVTLLPNGSVVYTRSGSRSVNYVVQPALAGYFSDGVPDPSRSPDLRAPNRPDFIEIRPNSGPIIGGTWILSVNGEERLGLTALTSNGMIDPTFNATFTPPVSPKVILRLPDGRYLVGGNFQQTNNVARPRLALLEADGSIITDFNLGSGPNQEVNFMRLLPDGKVLIAGSFNKIDGVTHKNVAIIDPNNLSSGTSPLDSTFTPANSEYLSIRDAVGQTDGKVILVGSFTTFAGQDFKNIVRLNRDGSIDQSFTAAQQFDSFFGYAVDIDTNGRIYVGGSSMRPVGSSIYRGIWRLLENGGIDNSFQCPAFISYVQDVQTLQTGGVYVAGSFYPSDTTERRNVAWLWDDGSLLPYFDAGDSSNSAIKTVTALPPDELYLTGTFSTFQGQRADGIARLNLDLRLPPQVSAIPAAQTVPEGGSASFQITGTGSGESYQWYYQNTPIEGATTDQLNLNHVDLMDAGTYSIQASNQTGSHSVQTTLDVDEFTYEEWATLQSFPPEKSAPDEDADEDGWSNADEHLLRTDPMSGAAYFKPQQSANSDGFHLNFATVPYREYWIKYATTDLSNWTPLYGPIQGDGESKTFIDDFQSDISQKFYTIEVRRR